MTQSSQLYQSVLDVLLPGNGKRIGPKRVRLTFTHDIEHCHKLSLCLMENLTKTQINTFLGGFLAHLKRKHELLLLFTVI